MLDGHRPILCAVDRSEPARTAGRLAASLADGLRSPLTLLHAIPAGPPLMELASVRRIPPSHPERHDLMLDEAHELLAQVAGEIGARSAHLVVGEGLPAETILERSASDGAELIVMGTGRRGIAASMFLGSVSSGVVKRSPRPVVLVPAHARPLSGPGPILAALDDDALAPGTAALAAGLAQRLGRELVLAHVVEPELGAVTMAGAVPVEVSDRRASAVLDRTAASLAPGCGCETVALRGPAAEQIVALARDRGSALVVAGSHRLGPLRSGLLGSVSSALLDADEVAVALVTTKSDLLQAEDEERR